jgi:DNA polymerase-3 subunit epsilon
VRQIVLDTETTGLEPDMGHRVIEIGAVELVNRKLTGRHFHKYINPERSIDDGALEVHGITREFLADKPVFEDVVGELIDFIKGGDLIIHNAPFDVSFLNYEFNLLQSRPAPVESICTITDSLAVARHKHPGQKNNLDALCRRYAVDNSQRQLHGALLDAEILADVYLLMTGGQTLLFSQAGDEVGGSRGAIAAGARDAGIDLKIVLADVAELADHEAYLDFLNERNSAPPVWRSLSEDIVHANPAG